MSELQKAPLSVVLANIPPNDLLRQRDRLAGRARAVEDDRDRLRLLIEAFLTRLDMGDVRLDPQIHAMRRAIDHENDERRPEGRPAPVSGRTGATSLRVLPDTEIEAIPGIDVCIDCERPLDRYGQCAPCEAEID